MEQHFNRNGNQFFFLCYSNEIAIVDKQVSKKNYVYEKFSTCNKTCIICHDMQYDHDIHEHEEMKSFFFVQLLNISMDSCFVLWMLIRIKNQWFFMCIHNMSWLLWCFNVGEKKSVKVSRKRFSRFYGFFYEIFTICAAIM